MAESCSREKLYETLNKLSNKELLDLANKTNLYNNNKKQQIAKLLNAECPTYNNKNIEHSIIFDLINRLLNKNIQSDNLDEIKNKKISENQLIKAIDDIKKNSIYFNNEAEYWYLFFDMEYVKSDACDNKYYLDMVKLILESCAILLKKKTSKINKKMIVRYTLNVDSNIKDIFEYKHRIQQKLPDSMQKHKSLFIDT